MGSASLGAGTLLGGADLYHNDGPFDYPDDYQRLNGVLRYHQGTAADFFTVTAMAYSGHWNSTDQVPQHAVTEGIIDRFGSLNPSDGGATRRASLSFNRVIRTDSDQVQLSAYLIRYQLDLWSTFTYYLKDPVNGDQMLQHDDRVVYGFNGSKTWYTHALGRPTTILLGAQGRMDDIRDVAIDATVARQYLSTQQDAGVRESNAALYAESEHRLVAYAAHYPRTARRPVLVRRQGQDAQPRRQLRSPQRSFGVQHRRGQRQHRQSQAGGRPRARGTARPTSSPSPRVTTATMPAASPAAAPIADAAPVTPLTRALSAELGLSATPLPRWQTTLDAFALRLRSELVFDGDAGVTTPSGATTRIGIESGNTFRINSWLHADLNAAFSRARFDHNTAPDDLGCGDAAPSHPCAQPIAISGRYIPNSPTNVIDAGLTAQHPSGWFGALKARHFGAAPLIEDNSAKSPAYTTVDLQVGYQRSSKWLLAVDVFNLFDAKWNDIEYYYVSRLQHEAAPSPDFVVHPGVPRTVRIHVQYFL